MLYLVATPIGNLKDITYRAVEMLKQCDLVACEDTRRTLKLLNSLDIKKPIVSYHEHNMKHMGMKLLEQAKEGKTICLLSDAGMPAISDPGEDLVRLFYDNHMEVGVIPGPSAFVCALVLSGFSLSRFVFEGFLSQKNKLKHERLKELSNEKRTMVFYEAPHRLLKTLEDMAEFFKPDRKAAVVREITKIHEEVLRNTLDELINHFRQNEPRGEIVIVIEGSSDVEELKKIPQKGIDFRYNELLAQGITNKDALKQVSAEYNLPRNEAYKIINKL